jgi:hypothetical protein
MVKKIFFFLILTTVLIRSQEIGVKAFTDTSDYKIGDYILFTVSVEYDKNIFLMNPFFQDSLKNIDVIKTETPITKEVGSKKITDYKFTLSRYDSSDVTIPSLPIYYKLAGSNAKISPVLTQELIKSDSTLKIAFSNPVSFTVHSLKVSKEEDIKDVKEPMTIPLDWKIILLWVLGGLILLVFIIFFVRKYILKKKGEVKSEKIIILPSHVRALNSLKQLELKELWKNGMVKEYHSEITEIIRKYFEERFNYPALELTTSESIELLKNYSDAKDILNVTRDFLTNADLVKFAKFIPMDSINFEMMNQARTIVQQTIPNQTEAMKESA